MMPCVRKLDLEKNAERESASGADSTYCGTWKDEKRKSGSGRWKIQRAGTDKQTVCLCKNQRSGCHRCGANNDESPADMSIPVPVDGTYENAFTKEAVPVVDGRLQVHLDACESKVFRKNDASSKGLV